MKETAMVREVRGTTITLTGRSGEACVGCATSRWCQSPEHLFEADNPRNFPLAAGDQVEVELTSTDALRAGLEVFVLPLLAFFLFFLGGGWLLGATGTPIAGLIGAGGMGAVIGAVLLLHRRNRAGRRPRIVAYHGAHALR